MEGLKLFFSVGCLVAMFTGSSALKCFECTSSDYGCEDEFVYNGNITIVDCLLSDYQCRKDIAFNKVTSRGCSPVGTVDDECKGVSFVAMICSCSRDLCNGRTTITASISNLTALVLVFGILTWE